MYCWEFLTRKTHAVLKLDNGLLVDVTNRRIIIPSDFHLHTQGTLRISSDQHVLINSGEGYDLYSGRRWGIWLNTEVDNNGEPVHNDSPLLEHEHNCSNDDCSCKELKDGTQ
jgi:hypothetical protein